MKNQTSNVVEYDDVVVVSFAYDVVSIVLGLSYGVL